MKQKSAADDMHNKRITVRLTQSQYQSIEEEAKLCKLPVSVYARHLVIGKEVSFVHPIMLDAKYVEPAVVALARVGNNLNQIARWLNRHTVIDDPLRAEASCAFEEVTSCARILTKLATEGINAGVDAWRSLSTSR
jgi:hypothetical protein